MLATVLSSFGVRQVAWSPNGRWLLARRSRMTRAAAFRSSQRCRRGRWLGCRQERPFETATNISASTTRGPYAGRAGSDRLRRRRDLGTWFVAAAGPGSVASASERGHPKGEVRAPAPGQTTHRSMTGGRHPTAAKTDAERFELFNAAIKDAVQGAARIRSTPSASTTSSSTGAEPRNRSNGC